MKTILFCFLFFAVSLSFGQNQNNIWIFGNNIQMDFNSGQPVLQYNSQLKSYEGSATICDADGKLLFYTNGGKLLTAFGTNHGGIWNRNNQLMPNGNLDSTSGCNSAAQGCIIVPSPAGSHLFYVFTLDCFENAFVGGLRYSIVDMALDGGLGDVTAKNILLEDTLTESICGIRHSNGRDYWLLVHGKDNDKFYAYQITPTGIQAPVMSMIGEYVGGNAGQMQATVRGNLIAYATTFRTMLFDFDNATGTVSNYRNLNKYSWGCSFASECRFLYTLSNDPPDTKLYQFDTEAADIASSAIEIASVNSLYRPLQLGPDGKIYFPDGVFNSTSLCVINSPDSLGLACNFLPNSFSLDTLTTTASMPVFIAGLYGYCGFVTTSIDNDYSKSSGLCVCPNPAKDWINIEWPTGIAENKIEILLYDANGVMLSSEFVVSNENHCPFLLPNGLNGNFYIMVRDKGQSIGVALLQIVN